MSDERPLPRRPLRVALGEWRASWPLYRVHLSEQPPQAFNASDAPGRFRPLRADGGSIIPTIYAADTLEGALAETVLRNVPLEGPDRGVLVGRLVAYSYSRLTSGRALALAILHDPQVRRLRVGSRDLGTCPPESYGWTAAWAQAIHDDAPRADGLIWVPRHHDSARAIMLFGDRVRDEEIGVSGIPPPLSCGIGRREVMRLLERADIALLEG